MYQDEEGFFYPKVDSSTCINCGLCEKVCPKQGDDREKLDIIAAYGIKNKDSSIVSQSSSGGFFSLLSEYVLSKGGIVFGARFDEQWNVIMDSTASIGNLFLFRGSKYVQCNTNNCFKKVRKALNNDLLVLFSGTSCQVLALTKFLRKPYDNLITLDFICHGVPSPLIWNKYLQEEMDHLSVQNVVGKNPVLSYSPSKMPMITDINFREKENYSWERYGFVVRGMSIPTDKNTVLLSYMKDDCPYMKGFLANITIRPSCGCCPAKDGYSLSDITMGDFWGAKEVNKHFYSDKGISLVLAHTAKGNKYIELLDCDRIPVSVDDVYLTNISYSHSAVLHPMRNSFFAALNTSPIIENLNKYARKSLKERMYYSLRSMLAHSGLNHKLNKLLRRIR